MNLQQKNLAQSKERFRNSDMTGVIFIRLQKHKLIIIVYQPPPLTTKKNLTNLFF